jgi:hypothetical protein
MNNNKFSLIKLANIAGNPVNPTSLSDVADLST